MKFNKTIKAVESTIKAVAVTVVCMGYGAHSAWAESKMETNQSSAKMLNEMKLMPTVGITSFNITGTSQTYSAKTGSSIGMMAQMPIGDGHLELETGLEYLETGAKQTLDFGILSVDALKVNVNQLAVPLLAKYIFNPKYEGAHWYGKGGLTPTYVMSAKAEAFGGESADIKSEMNQFGLLAQAGAGADWSLDVIPGRVNLDFTYSYGLTKVFKEDGGRSSGIQIQAGYIINL